MLIELTLAKIAQICDGELIGKDQPVFNIISDTRSIPSGSLFVAFKGERFDGHDYAKQALEQGAVAVLSEQTLPLKSYIKVADTRRAYGQIARAVREAFTGPVVCITGSNGKTSVKDWLAQSLNHHNVLKTQANLNNQIGVPQTLLGLQAGQDVAVVETGTSIPGEIERLASIAYPDVVILTNASGSHFEGFGDLQGIAIEKGQLISGAKPTAKIILNADDGFYDYWCGLAQGREVLSFGFTDKADLYAHDIQLGDQASQVTLSYLGQSVRVEVGSPGKHQIANGMAVVLAMLAIGEDFHFAVSQLRKPAFVAGRLERLCTKNEALLINDCYNASPASVKAAIDVLSMQKVSKTWLILGALGELGDQQESIHHELGEYAFQQGIDHLICVGDIAAIAGRGFTQGNAKALFCQSHAEAAQLVQTLDKNHAILVKGSRSAKMENVIKALIN